MDGTCCFHDIRLGPKTSVYHTKVFVVSAVTGCDVTTVQQHYTGSTSTPPREAVSDSRGVPRCTEKNPKNLLLLTCVDRSTRPLHHIRIQRFPQSLHHTPGWPVSIGSVVHIRSINLNLWHRSRPSVCVPISLEFTSVLTDDIV